MDRSKQYKALGILPIGDEARRSHATWTIPKVLKDPVGAISLAVVVAIVLLAVGGSVVAPHDPTDMQYSSVLAPPSLGHPFGTDEMGRDVLSRMIYGTRPSLLVGFGSVFFGITFGALVGLLTAYFGKGVDLLVQRLIDILLAFPTLILAMLVVAALGPSMMNVLIAIAIARIPWGARVIRATALSIRETQYVEAEEAMGASGARILLHHMLPNCIAPFLVLATASIGTAIVTESSLSFLGLGVQPPLISWGGLLSESGRRFAAVAPWTAIFPGLAITLIVLAFNFLGDALRDAWDPRLRRQ